MPDLNPTIDGRGIKVGTTWANTVEDGVTANSINTTTAHWNSGINAIDLSAFNATQVERYFVEFDTSGVTSTPSSGTFKLYGKSGTAADVICVQASFASAGAIVTDDWDSWNEASPVAYTNELETWSTSGYNEFTLTAAALSAMASLDEFQMICLEADNDYDQTSAGSGLSISSGYYTRNESGKEPILSYVDGGPSVGKVTLDGAKLQIVTGKFLID